MLAVVEGATVMAATLAGQTPDPKLEEKRRLNERHTKIHQTVLEDT